MQFWFIINFGVVYYKRYQSLLKTILVVWGDHRKRNVYKYKQNRAMIAKSLPYDIFVLILDKISLKAFYVSIFLVIIMSFIDFVFSKIQNKKPFVKGFRRKAGYSLNQSIFFEKYITIASIINSPKLPANNAKVSSWIRTNI